MTRFIYDLLNRKMGSHSGLSESRDHVVGHHLGDAFAVMCISQRGSCPNHELNAATTPGCTIAAA